MSGGREFEKRSAGLHRMNVNTDLISACGDDDEGV